MTIGAVHAIYLLESGLPIHIIAFLQTIFSVTVFIFEYPTGIIADKYSRKVSVLVGIGFTSLLYPLYLLAPRLPFLILAEFFYGIGLCCMSGAIEGWINSWIYNETGSKAKSHIDSSFQRLNEYVALGSSFTGFLGALLSIHSGLGLKFPYVVSFIFMVICFIFFLTVPNITSREAATYNHIVKESIKKLLFNKMGFYFAFITSLFVAIYQPILHYWQPFLINKFKDAELMIKFVTDPNDNEIILLGMTFVLINITKYFGTNFFRKKILHKYSIYKYSFSLIALSIIFTSILCSSRIPLGIYSVIIFSFLHTSLSLSITSINTQFYKTLNQNTFSSTLSANSVLNRLAGIVVVAVLSAFLTDKLLNVTFNINIIFLVIIGLVLLDWFPLIKCEIKNETSNRTVY
jgi:MFS family permease